MYISLDVDELLNNRVEVLREISFCISTAKIKADFRPETTSE
jgi:hypothetical protein